MLHIATQGSNLVPKAFLNSTAPNEIAIEFGNKQLDLIRLMLHQTVLHYKSSSLWLFEVSSRNLHTTQPPPKITFILLLQIPLYITMATRFFILVFIVCLAVQVNAVTYWIDSSCLGKLGEATLDEIRLMASEGNTRLQNADDEIMADAFLKIFKVDKTKTAATTTANSEWALGSCWY